MKTTPDLDLELGMAHLHAGRWQQGIDGLKAVLAREPAFAEVWSNLGFALCQARRPEEAREALQRAVALKPQLPDAWNLLGLLEQEAGRHEDANRHFEKALVARSDFAAAWMNRANSEQALGRLEAALAMYGRALELEPGNAAIHYNLGHLHHKVTGRLAEAEARYREAMRLDPRIANAHLNLAQVLAVQGRLAEAWPEFAWRTPRLEHLQRRAREGARYELPSTEPWPAHLEIRGEQGLGDILFFLRYAEPAARKGGTRSFNGDSRLHPMLLRTGLFSQLNEEAERESPAATEVLAGDLPLLFADPDESARPPTPLTLQADATRRKRMTARLQALGPRPWVALTWRAGEPGGGFLERLFKEVPVEALGAALGSRVATWLSVQRGPAAGEREALERALGAAVHDLSDVNADLEEALCVMDLADEYIGVSNTNMHLRAGLGRGARVLVPFPPEWRWGLAGPSPWFPLMTTCRQEPGGDWSRALAELSTGWP